MPAPKPQNYSRWLDPGDPAQLPVANKEALYNFLSTFSGTHYVTPHAITATIGFHF
jgi:hypothetical protein